METRRWLTGILVAGLVFALAGSSAAQLMTPEKMGLNYSLSVGAAFPVNGDVNEDASFMAGVSWYGSAGNELGESAAFGLTADWTSITRFDGEEVNLVPVLLNYRQYRGLGGYRIYGTLGLGILAADDNIPEMQIDNGVQLGWQLEAGVDLSNALHASVRFIAGSHPGDDGLVVGQVAYRL